MPYRIYLKRKTPCGSEVSEKTNTDSPAVAAFAFRELRARNEFSGQNVAAVLSGDHQQLYYHRFDRQPGEADFVPLDDPLEKLE